MVINNIDGPTITSADSIIRIAGTAIAISSGASLKIHMMTTEKQIKYCIKEIERVLKRDVHSINPVGGRIELKEIREELNGI